MGSRWELLRLFFREREDPEPFYARLAADVVACFPFPLSDATVADLGCGPGIYTRALREAGAVVVPLDRDAEEFGSLPPEGAVLADAARLPLRTGRLDGVFCSNMLEHTPAPEAVLDEVERLLHPGGWAWLSWTNWYSPWGGHEISPLHYLGPRWGLAAHRRLHRPSPKNEPGRSLFPLHVGEMLRAVARRPALDLVDAMPRYWPRQRWLLQVPGLREVATWNCLLLLERHE